MANNQLRRCLYSFTKNYSHGVSGGCISSYRSALTLVSFSVGVCPCFFSRHLSTGQNILQTLPLSRLCTGTEADSDSELKEKIKELCRNDQIRKVLEDEGMEWDDTEAFRSVQKWERVSSTLLASQDPPLATMMDFCAEGGPSFLQSGLHLAKHIRSHNLKSHFTVDLKYLKLLANNVEQNPELDKQLSTEYQRFLTTHTSSLSIINVVRHLIADISRSKMWISGFELLGKLKVQKEATWLDYLPLMTAAAKDSQLDVVLLLLTDFLRISSPEGKLDITQLHDLQGVSTVWGLVLDSMLEKNKETSKSHMEKILAHWRHTGFIPHRDVAEKVASWFHNFRQEYCVTEVVKMPKHGYCPVTASRLESLQVDAEAFQKLQKQFLDNVLVRENVYINSTPKEMTVLARFLKANLPFDVVIDGLNVFHHDGNVSQSQRMEQVLHVVEHFAVKLDMKVAVVARTFWFKPVYEKLRRKIERNAELFITEHLSKDDLFQIHFCLASGDQCFLVSNDFYRDARKMFQPELQSSFVHWQHARQIHFESKPNQSVSKEFVIPRCYNTVVQEVDGVLFIPYHEWTEEELCLLSIQDTLAGKTSSLSASLRLPETFIVVEPKRRRQKVLLRDYQKPKSSGYEKGSNAEKIRRLYMSQYESNYGHKHSNSLSEESYEEGSNADKIQKPESILKNYIKKYSNSSDFESK